MFHRDEQESLQLRLILSSSSLDSNIETGAFFYLKSSLGYN